MRQTEAAEDKNRCGCNGIEDSPKLFIVEQQINNLGQFKISNCTLGLSVTRNDELSLLESVYLGIPRRNAGELTLRSWPLTWGCWERATGRAWHALTIYHSTLTELSLTPLWQRIMIEWCRDRVTLAEGACILLPL